MVVPALTLQTSVATYLWLTKEGSLKENDFGANFAKGCSDFNSWPTNGFSVSNHKKLNYFLAGGAESNRDSWGNIDSRAKIQRIAPFWGVRFLLEGQGEGQKASTCDFQVHTDVKMFRCAFLVSKWTGVQFVWWGFLVGIFGVIF